MYKNSMTYPTTVQPAPSRPGIVYTQRSTEFARIIGSARILGGAK